MRCRSEILTHSRAVSRVSVRGELVVTCGEDCAITVIRILRDGSVMVSHLLQGHVSRVRCVSIDGLRLLSGSDDRSAKVWEVWRGEVVTASLTMTGHAWPVSQTELSPGLALTGDTETVRLWSLPTGDLVRTIRLSTSQLSLDLSSGCLLVTGDRGNILCFTLHSDSFWQTEAGPAKCPGMLGVGLSCLLLLTRRTGSLHISLLDFLN